jgi:hypothetical protein
LGEGKAGKTLAAASPRTPSAAIKWLDPTSPHPSVDELQLASSTKVLGASGWHVPGEPSLQADPLPVQVTHPQPLETPRQTILR